MNKNERINIRNLDIDDLEKVFGGKDPINDCPVIDVVTDSDKYQCGEGKP